VLKQRVLTAIVLLGLFLLALFALPDALWAALVGAMLLQGASEWARLSKLEGGERRQYLIFSALLTLALLALFLFAPAEIRLVPELLLYGAAALLWTVIVPAWMITGWKPDSPWLMGVAGWALLLPTGLAMLELRSANPWWLLGIMALVWIADSCAYFAGRAFGKHKLAPAISPGKTWEGVAGALAGVTVYVLAVAWYTGLHQHYLIFPSGILAAWWWVGLSVMGDLFESLIKRQAGVKDSGNLLPGHGGLLDRIDALTSTLPLAALTLVLQGLA
jgi:phosphatidate cytidylyltransferase